jgi:hypothetical protein
MQAFAMDNPIPVTGSAVEAVEADSSATSAVSWAAILAGAVVAASTSLLLIALGGGIGLAAVSPWANAGASVTTFAVATAIGLIVIQWVSAGIGGYITGRLRTRWTSLHTHEVFFRDTAHGFITWAASTLLVTAAVALMAGSALGSAARAAASVGSAATNAAASTVSIDPYDVDSLLRSASGNAAAGADARPQITRILANALTTGDLPADDRAYLTQVLAAQTGISSADAQTRVDTVIAKIKAAKVQAQQTADSVRKAARSASIFTALAMLVGAFIASISAALGGKLRDLHP